MMKQFKLQSYIQTNTHTHTLAHAHSVSILVSYIQNGPKVS